MTRLLTAVLGIAVIVGVTVWGPRWSFVLLVLAVAGFAFDEYLAIAAEGGLPRPGRWVLVSGLAVTLAFSGDAGWVIRALVGQVFLLSVVAMRSRDRGQHLSYIASGIGGTVYACLLPGFFLMMPTAALWTLLGTVWAGDTAAYYGGRLMGRHKLAPMLSPKKTVEGAIAGAVASAGVGTALGSVWLGRPFLALLAMCLAAGLAGQIGDLAESAMKRSAGIKDSSNRLPGHGGVLDRVDSLLFAAPVFQFLLVWMS
jgi:phosphatidate cytidylyltransferase